MPSTRTTLRNAKEHTVFASFKAFSHKPLTTYALLRSMSRPCSEAVSRERNAEYSEMATSRCWAFMAAPPGPSSFSDKRCLNSNRELSQTIISTRCARSLTYDPCRLLAVQVCLPSQFVHHLVKTPSRIHYLLERVELFTDGPINCEFRDHKLRGVSDP